MADEHAGFGNWKGVKKWFDASVKAQPKMTQVGPEELAYTQLSEGSEIVVNPSEDFSQKWLTLQHPQAQMVGWDETAGTIGGSFTSPSIDANAVSASTVDWNDPAWTPANQQWLQPPATTTYKMYPDNVKRSLWMPCWVEEADGRVLPAMVKMDLAGPAHEMENAVQVLDHIPANFPPIPPGKVIAAEEIVL